MTSPISPPAWAEALLERAVRGVPGGASILGDLREDWAERVHRRPGWATTIWYCREACALVAGIWVQRLAARSGITGTGGVGIMKETILASGAVRDLAYALRAVRRDRRFAVFATLVIGLGVGASTAVFSVVSPLLIRPLPLDEPERLVMIENGDGSGGLSGVTSRTSNVRDFRARSRSFDGIAGYNAFFDQQSFNLTGAGRPERLSGVNVSDDFIDVLGVSMALGRDFTAEEGRWSGPRAMILTHGFWLRRFGGDPAVVGRSLSLNDEPYVVVGVLPTSFDFASVFTPTQRVDFLLPWPIADETDAWGNTTTMVGRLAPGVTIEAAQRELESIVAALQQAEPRRWGLGARVAGLQERIARPFRAGLYLLVAAAALVMLIVCVNLSNMLLARSPRRRREVAVRRALGATRGRLVRQLLLESLVISAGGAVVGLVAARWVTRFVSTRAGLEIPMLSAVSLDGTALAFTVGIAVIAGLAVGVIPALQVSEAGEAEAMGGSTRGTGGGRGARRLRDALVVSEVALACVLLVFGGLVVRSFRAVMDVELGFEPAQAIGWQLASSRTFDTLPEIVAFYDEIVTNVQAVPGVEAVGLVDALPLGTNRTWGLRVVGKEYAEGEGDSFFPHIVDERYLSAMGIPLLAGRLFGPTDDLASEPVVIVSEAAEERIFDGDAIGRYVRLNGADRLVVGVVGNVMHRGLDLGADPELYIPMRQMWAFQTVEMVVRTALPAESVSASVGAAVRRVEPLMPTEDFRSLDAVVERSVSPRRFTLQVLVAFGLIALVLAGLGIYGVISYSVSERIPEIGIRMALGASAAEVRRGIVGRTMGLAAVGLTCGAIIALVGTRAIRSLLFGVAPSDPLTFGATIAILSGVALLSGLGPAMRASRTDSATALRSDA